MQKDRIAEFLDQVSAWARTRTDVRGVALVGSYARGTAHEGSDLDLVILLDEPGQLLSETTWIEQFGKLISSQTEDYGRLTSLRAWYSDGLEVEFGLTDPDWAAEPLDEGTRRVVSNGIVIQYERDDAFEAVRGYSRAGL